MMRGERFHFPDGKLPQLAIFVMRNPDGGTHTGILHENRGALFTLDLCWHLSLRSCICRRPGPYVVPSLDPDEINDVTAMCRLIHTRHTSGDSKREYRIPYSLRRSKNTHFDNRSADLLLEDGLGLTCSTFVLAVFDSAFVPLVDLDWERRGGDDARHQHLLDMLRNGVPEHGIAPATPEHVAAVEAELPCIRVRPEEVAAAGLSDSWPVRFEPAARAGRWILESLTQGVERARI